MDLIDRLEQALNVEESLFRAQLLREDMARLKKLRELAGTAATEEEFLHEGFCLDWTPAGLRNADLKATLQPLLKTFRAAERNSYADGDDVGLLRAWQAFDAERMELLVGCLARVPKPDFD